MYQSNSDSSSSSENGAYEGEENSTNFASIPQDKILDLSYLDLDTATLRENFDTSDPYSNAPVQQRTTEVIFLHHNNLNSLPWNIGQFQNLQHLDISNNDFTELPDSVLQLQHLHTLIARGNRLDDNSLPKDFGFLSSLQVLNLSGNSFSFLPPQILELTSLKALYIGSNFIEFLPADIWRLQCLEVLYLGGNRLQEIPSEMGQLQNLQALVLSENRLISLPSTFNCLKRLRSLALHKNMLTTLPPAIVKLKGLVELSLRDNPLVVRFVRDLDFNPPSLMEMAARCIKTYKVPYTEHELPSSLSQYLSSAQRCVNPKCKGVYFDARVEHIKFVDFCGKYRLPLLQYLCSPSCTELGICTSCSDTENSDSDAEVSVSKLKRVLLG